MIGGVWFGAPYFGQGPLGGTVPVILVVSRALVTTTSEGDIRTTSPGAVRTTA